MTPAALGQAAIGHDLSGSSRDIPPLAWARRRETPGMPGKVYGVAPLIRISGRIADMHVVATGRLFARVSSGV